MFLKKRKKRWRRVDRCPLFILCKCTMDPQKCTLIPFNIVLEILHFCETKEICSFRITCRKIREYANVYLPLWSVKSMNYFTNNACITACNASLNFGVLDSSCNTLFISDKFTNAIRRIDLSSNQTNILCGNSQKNGLKDGFGTSVQFNCPLGLALNKEEDALYISDSRNSVIRKVSLHDAKVVTIYGRKRKGNELTFNGPEGLALDSILNHLYVADSKDHSIKKISLNEGKIETLCGTGSRGWVDGTFKEAMFSNPCDVVFNASTQELYVSDSINNVIRVISLTTKTVKTLCGTPRVNGFRDDIHHRAKFDFPRGLGLDAQFKYLYVCDFWNHKVRRISLLGEVKVDTLHIIARNPSRVFSNPRGIAVDSHNSILYVIDASGIKKLTHKK